jgi:hypothetical protein
MRVSMVDQDRADGAPDKTLAAAEELAAREAAAETATDTTTPAEPPKVVRPKAKTSGRVTPSRVAATGSTVPAAAEVASVGLVPAAISGAGGRARPGEFEGSVSIERSGAAVVNARSVDVRQGGIRSVRAVDVAVSQGGIGLARGERISVEMGGIGAAIGADVRLTQGGANMILARDVRIEQSGVRSIVANNVHVERTTGVFVMIARHVEGDVRTLLDWRGAIAFGAAFGLVVSFFRRRR